MNQLFRFAAVAVASGIVLSVGCAKSGQSSRELTILIRMMPQQERFLQDEIIPGFEKENNCKVQIARFENQWDIERLLRLESGKKKPAVDLVKTPFEMTRVLVAKGMMEPLTEIGDSQQVMKDLAEYHQLPNGLGFIDDAPYYIPRKLETRIFFYLKSKVADAVSKYESHKERIDRELKKENGFGLPDAYTLEDDPNKWDFYDLYVVGSIWANESYNDITMGRIAHRGARYGGTALFFVDRALQLGATADNIMNVKGEALAETFLWEDVFTRNGLYNIGIWQDSWEGSDIYNAIKDGKVFCAWMQQIDCFNLHGWEEDPGMPGYLADRDDMGLAIIPKAVSFALDENGKPVAEGTRAISTGGWWWGVPKTSGNKALAYEFARYITSREIQARECSQFGMIPIRKDILMNLGNVFDEGWVGDIFKVSVEQISENELTTVPLDKQFSRVSQQIVDTWYEIVVSPEPKRDEPLSVEEMHAILEARNTTDGEQ